MEINQKTTGDNKDLVTKEYLDLKIAQINLRISELDEKVSGLDEKVSGLEKKISGNIKWIAGMFVTQSFLMIGVMIGLFKLLGIN